MWMLWKDVPVVLSHSVRDAGVLLNPPGSTFPYGKDPKDSNIRLAPSYPPVDELKKAIEIFAVCVQIVALEHLLQK